MRFILIFSVLFLFQFVKAQTPLPLFLRGDWSIVGTKDSEQWNILNENSMKGFGYTKTSNNIPAISEFLDIKIKEGNLVLIATVLGQNNGNPIEFKGTLDQEKKEVKFVNYNHDFPQEISYSFIDEPIPILNVRIAGAGKEKYIKMEKSDYSEVAEDTIYDKELAQKLGADDYGMKSFYFVILKTGPVINNNKEFVNDAFKGHMLNINKLVKEDKLIVAGPFGKNPDQYRGLFILNNVKTEEEVIELLKSDPAIKAGLLSYSIYNWYGSAALPLYMPLVKKITKSEF